MTIEESKSRKATKPQKEKPVPIMPLTPKRPTSAVSPEPNEVRQRIASLKQQMVHIETDVKLFEYDPDQPLHLMRDE
jgi:hypothetical protein